MSSRTSIGGLISRAAKRHPGKAFYISTDSGRALTYGRLEQQCVALGRQFSALGLSRGDKVSVYMPNSEHTALLLLGIMASGLVANPINLMSQPSQLRYVLWHSDARLVFTTSDRVDAVRILLAELDRPVQLVVVDTLDDDLPVFSPTADCGNVSANGMRTIDAGCDALLMYTSGTTGTPKGVLLTHGNLLESARNISVEHKLSDSDRVLGSLPLYHINGLVVTLLAPLAHGGSVAMTPRFSATTFWREASRYRCTWINVVPTIIAYLLNDGQSADGLDRSLVRFCRSASSALSPGHLHAFENRFGIGVIETMGLTETAAPAFSNPYSAKERKTGSVGRPSGVQARIIDRQGCPVSDGGHGEIVIRGKTVMRGYYKDPERTQAAFTSDGWLRTGDIGYRDDDGFFYVIGRAKEIIIKGGENIAPREIDEAVVKHPCVLDAAAVGIPHPDYGQDIAVYLVLRENATFDDDEMRRHCLNELGKYKSPARYVVVDELPRGPSGKVQRLKLLDL